MLRSFSSGYGRVRSSAIADLELYHERVEELNATEYIPNAIVIAQRAGETDEEIAHVTEYTVPMIHAELRSS